MSNNKELIDKIIKNRDEIIELIDKDKLEKLHLMFGLYLLGKGESKLAFSIENDPDIILKVLKYGINNTFINDIRYYECSPRYFPKVYYADRRIEIVERIKVYSGTYNNIEALKYFGISYGVMKDLIDKTGLRESEGLLYSFVSNKSMLTIFNLLIEYKYYISVHGKVMKPIYDYLLSLNKLKEFLINMKKCNISIDDLHEGNFGFREKDGQFVLVDIYGNEFEAKDLSLESIIYSKASNDPFKAPKLI